MPDRHRDVAAVWRPRWMTRHFIWKRDTGNGLCVTAIEVARHQEAFRLLTGVAEECDTFAIGREGWTRVDIVHEFARGAAERRNGVKVADAAAGLAPGVVHVVAVGRE